MVNPLDLLRFRTKQIRPEVRHDVHLPHGVAGTDALFVVLRRMRRPFIVVIATFSFCTAGMMLMPGTDPNGKPYRLTLFDSFYQMTITLTTVGYTEAPHAFSYPQRMWVSLSIFMLVISWAYAIGSLFAALQDPAFRNTLAAQRFRMRVRRLVEPFYVVAGYGHAGRTVTRSLDAQGRRLVVLDKEQAPIDAAGADPLYADVAALSGDCSDPAVLGLAGMGKPSCSGVLALTNDDEANLAVVMTAALLSPDVPVYARCTDRRIAGRMEGFGPNAIINPNDRYGGYLSLAAHQPAVHQLLVWLMENEHPELGPEPEGLAQGLWIVCGEGQFAEEVAEDLELSNLRVERFDENEDTGRLRNAAAFVAGTDNDMTNVALAECARQANPDIFLAVQQVDSVHRPLLDAMDVESVFIATELVAREVLARIVNPVFWRFVEEAVQRDDTWARELRDRLVEHCGTRIPERDVIHIDTSGAPAVARWMLHHEFTVGDLLRHPDDRDVRLELEVLMILRDDELLVTPTDETPLQLGDQVLVAGTNSGLDDVSDVLFAPATVEYLVTGVRVPSAWLWRWLTDRGVLKPVRLPTR